MTKKMKKNLLFKLANIISKNTTLIGLRPGEELYEDLISESELEFSELKGEYILIRNERNQNRGTRLEESISSDTATEMSDKEIFQMVEFIKNNSFLNEHY